MFPVPICISQPSTGDWIVTGTEVVENKTISLDGNLTVESGGSLILRNVTLTLNAQYNGQHGISVQAGGSLFIYNCSISSATKNGFSFVANGSSFIMRGSEMQGVGWELPPGDTAQSCLNNLDALSHFGLIVATDQAEIEDNIFSGNDIGLILSGSYSTVARNTFSYNKLFSTVVYSSHNNTVANNTLLQNPCAFGTSMVQLCSADNNTFNSNLLVENISYFLQHRLSGDTRRMDGFCLDNSHANAFVNNNITVQNIPVFLIRSHDCLVADNRMNYGEMAVNILTGVNSRIERNEMNALSAGPGDFVPYAAIIATLAHNSIMANNTITGRSDRGIHLAHTSNSSILNNDIRLTRAGDPDTMTFGGTAGVIVLVGSENDSLVGNTVSGSEFGMILVGSSDGNLITQNSIFTDHSISILGSHSNRIFLNNLYDFPEPLGGPYDDGVNFWYSGKDGNYWSHFTGRDAEGNGVGDQVYSRSAIPPSGAEPLSLTSPADITPSPVPLMKAIPRPKLGAHYIPLNVISNQVMEIGWGDFPDNLTIINSTLFLGAEGLVRMGSYVSITNSTLINMGYGFCPWGMGQPSAPHLTIMNSTLDGAFLDDVQVDNVTIVNSTILNSMGVWGISVYRSSSVTIVNSTVSGELGGICTSNEVSSPPVISGNHVCNVVDYGIFAGTPNATVANNVIEGSGMGIGILVGGGNAVVMENIMSNVGFGIELSGPRNLVFQNDVVNSRHPILDCGGALIYHNNFLNYSSFPYDQSEFNELSCDGEGNYWSNYTGEDRNLDGIGDSPLMITGGGARDSHPFMTPNGWLTAFWLTVNTNFPSIPFQVNGTSFSTELNGNKILRLGYSGYYVVSFPRIVETAQTRFSLQSVNNANSSVLMLNVLSNTTVTATYTAGPIPEFPSIIVLIIFMLATMLVCEVWWNKPGIKHSTCTRQSGKKGSFLCFEGGDYFIFFATFLLLPARANGVKL